MAMRSSSRASPPVKYLFIDGAYLDHVIADMSKKLWGIDPVPLDYRALSAGYTKTFYYNCPPPALTNELDAESAKRTDPYFKRLHELSELSGWHVFEGTTKRSKKRGATQKEVDVQIAVDLLTNSFKANMDSATLLAGDQDFRPVVEAASREGMFVTVWCEPSSASRELRHAADERDALDFFRFQGLIAPHTQVPYRLPERHRATQLPDGKARPNNKGISGSGLEFRLDHEPNGSVYLWQLAPVSPGLFEFYTHADAVVAMKFLEVLHGPIVWD